jgi:DNA-binding transcriptional LysR family regulator
VIHGILVKIFNPEGEKLFPVIQKTVRRYEELRQKEEELQQKEEELQGLIDGGAGTWIFASGKTGDSENCL